jgi:hypothetical protein
MKMVLFPEIDDGSIYALKINSTRAGYYLQDHLCNIMAY